MSIKTNGIADYLQKKWLSREFHDRSFPEADSIGVTIGHVQGLLAAFGIAVSVAVAVMIVELAISRSRTPCEEAQWPLRSALKKSKFPRYYQ